MRRERMTMDFGSVKIAVIECDEEPVGQARSQMATMPLLEDDEVNAASTEETRNHHSPCNC